MNKLRVGVIGGSIHNGWAKDTHIPAIQHLSEFELKAVSTSRVESAEQSAREFNATYTFTGADELSQHPEVDMVVVSVRVPHHLEAIKAAASAKKHVYCEWPLALNTAQAIEMEQLVETAGIHHAVGLQARQSPEVNYLKDLIADGYVGEVRSAHMKVFTNMMDSWAYSRSQYLFDRFSGGNLFAIQGGHSLDTLTYIFGEFTELSAMKECQYSHVKLKDTGETIPKNSDDQILIHGKFTSGVVCSVHIQSKVTPRPEISLEIFGDQGKLMLVGHESNGNIQFGSFKLMGARNREEQTTISEPLKVPESYLWATELLDKKHERVFNVAQAHRKFAQDIINGTSHIPNFQDAVRLHRLLDTVQKAAETGQRQSL